MRLGFIFFIGIFTNLMLATIFPYQLLPADDAAVLVGDDVYYYNLDNNNYFGTDVKTASGELSDTLKNNANSGELLTTNQQGSDILGSVGFFDGLFDALTKVGIYLSLIMPFSGVLYLLPGALGFVFGGLYMGVIAFAIIRFIRGA